MIFLQRWHLLSWSHPVLFYQQQVNKTKQQVVSSPVGSPCLELCCHGLGGSFPIPGVFTLLLASPPELRGCSCLDASLRHGLQSEDLCPPTKSE